MKIFISHASKDASVARQLAEQLEATGHSVWIPENEILPGDNWAKKEGQALEDSDIIIVLATPQAFESESVTREIQYALTAKHIKGRVIPVFLGPESKKPSQMPWILQKLEPLRIRGKKPDWQKVIEKVDALAS
jgi:TIR domain